MEPVEIAMKEAARRLVVPLILSVVATAANAYAAQDGDATADGKGASAFDSPVRPWVWPTVGRVFPRDVREEWAILKILLRMSLEQMDAITAGFALRANGPLRVDIADLRLAQDADGQETCF